MAQVSSPQLHYLQLIYPAMPESPNRLKRALELAQSGRMVDLTDIRQTLRSEGYADEGELGNADVKSQLRKLIAEANPNMRQYPR